MTPEEELAANQLGMLGPGNLVEFKDERGFTKQLIVDKRDPEGDSIPLLGKKGGEYRFVIKGNAVRFQFKSPSKGWITNQNLNVTDIRSDLFQE